MEPELRHSGAPVKRLTVVFLILVSMCAVAFAQPSPPVISTPVPVSSGGAALVRYTGQVLDYQNGFLFFTTGDGYRVAPNVRIIDAATGAPTAKLPTTRLYARAGFDALGNVVEIALSTKQLPAAVAYESIKQFAVVKTQKQTNPDFAKKHTGIEGKPVLVTFIVTVPPTTPLTEQVYISTDKSGWQANAIRMDRIDALRYRYTAKILSGTELNYLYTRGTWTTVERGRNGLEQVAHHAFIGNLDTDNFTNQVYYWADQGGGGPNAQATFNPAALPTPFNPSPFNFPQPGRYGTPGPFPTPNPKPTKPPTG